MLASVFLVLPFNVALIPRLVLYHSELWTEGAALARVANVELALACNQDYALSRTLPVLPPGVPFRHLLYHLLELRTAGDSDVWLTAPRSVGELYIADDGWLWYGRGTNAVWPICFTGPHHPWHHGESLSLSTGHSVLLLQSRLGCPRAGCCMHRLASPRCTLAALC